MKDQFMYLKSDLITSDYAGLAKSTEEYAHYAKTDHAIADELIPILKRANANETSHQGYKAVVQALFESGFLSTSDSDFNAGQLFNYIYGVKCVHALDAFTQLHHFLMNNEYTDHLGTLKPSELYEVGDKLQCFNCDEEFPLSHDKESGCSNCTSSFNQKVFNTSGDNYYSAYQFEHSLSDTEKFVIKHHPRKKGNEYPKAYDRVIVVENQSPMWAFVVTGCPFSGEDKDFFIVRIKSNYDDENRLEELLELVKNNQLKNSFNWSINNSTNYGIIAHVTISDMQCSVVVEPKAIESALFNIYSGQCCVKEAEKST